jgi:Saccharopine dehydrogenase NADP binding domain
VSGVVVFGGYGNFGGHVVRELVRRGVPVVVAGRDCAKADVVADVTDAASCRAALGGRAVAVNCAGPFARFDDTLLQVCLELGCHYADIADDRGYVNRVRRLGPRFAGRGLSAVYGCSSLPAVSGALALAARDGTGPPPGRARVTLFVGNDNPKGSAAVRSVVEGLGRPIAAPQGTEHGFRGRRVVTLPEPFGRQVVFHFDTPEYDLFPDLLGVRSVSVLLGFELRPVTHLFALLAALGVGRDWTDWLLRPAALGRGVGCSGGAVMSELFWPDGTTRRASLSGRADGQRMAALPAALVAAALATGVGGARGAVTAYDYLGGRTLLAGLTAEGFELRLSGGRRP